MIPMISYGHGTSCSSQAVCDPEGIGMQYIVMIWSGSAAARTSTTVPDWIS